MYIFSFAQVFSVSSFVLSNPQDLSLYILLFTSPEPRSPPRPTVQTGGVHEDPRKLADFAARTETRDGQLDQEEAGVGVVTGGFGLNSGFCARVLAAQRISDQGIA